MALRNYIKPFYCAGAVQYLLFCCLLPDTVAQGLMPGCQLQKIKSSGFSRDGDILIGGIFWVHFAAVQQEITFREQPVPATCQTFAFPNYQRVQAMVFGIEEINNNPSILPNITLGFQIYDSCTMLQRSIKGTLWILSGQAEPIPNYRCQRRLPPAAIIGDSLSTRSILLARILGLYRYPQISYFSTSPLLSDRNQFPSFFRTIPSDDVQSRGLAQLVMHFGWTWVGILATDDDYGQQASHIVKHELIKAGACVAFAENILQNHADKNSFHVVKVIKSSTAKAIVVFSSNVYLVPLLDEAARQNVTGKIWIASEAWSTYSLLSIKKYSDILDGTIGFAIHSGEMEGFRKHILSIRPSTSPGDTFVRRFWEEAFGCQWSDQGDLLKIKDNSTKLCTGDENLDRVFSDDMMEFRLTYNIYNAVYATALALKDLRACTQEGGRIPQENCANILDFQPWQLLHYVKKVRLEKEHTNVFFDKNGNPPARYDIINWQRSPDGMIRQLKVGSYDFSATPGKTLVINTSALRWDAGSTQVPVSVCSPSCPVGFRKATLPGKPMCCFQCVPCLMGDISNQTDSRECIKCPWDQWPNKEQDKCTPKITEFLSYKETFGATLAASSIFSSVIPAAILAIFAHFNNTPIVKASNSKLSYVLLLSLTLCFLCSLSFIGYPTADKCLLRQPAFGITFTLCVSCILAKTIMVVLAFNATKPNSDLKRWVGPRVSYTIITVSTLIQVILCVFWLVLAPPYSEYNTYTRPGIILVECNEGSPFAFWCMLGYLGLLSTISFIVAFLARKLPDCFNEAKFITFSMLAFLSVWISFIPAYLSTKGKYMVAMEIFAILSSALSLVFCIFLPKCYIILLKPQRNSKEYLMGRGDALTRKL
ncbi:extracellular calcium-sensing receptor-like [Ambystoma mexicanum]|uniref:extracellular calcium-sensing receptor-like n=1 Tax=Ambystoma mexicanum TaxID=8296 RepID=UPI0037E79AF4